MIDVRAADPAASAEQLAIGFADDAQLDVIATQVLPLAAREALAAWDPRPEVGQAEVLPLPGMIPSQLIVAGLGEGTAADLRAAGAAVARAATGESITVALPASSAVVEG